MIIILKGIIPSIYTLGLRRFAGSASLFFQSGIFLETTRRRVEYSPAGRRFLPAVSCFPGFFRAYSLSAAHQTLLIRFRAKLKPHKRFILQYL